MTRLLQIPLLFAALATASAFASEPVKEATPVPASVPSVTPAPTPTDAAVQARSSALEVAGAFSNDGFKIRDGHWTNLIAPKETRIIQVNLYAGNQYWFVAAASEEAKKLAVTVYDETGQPLSTEPYRNNAQAAAGFAPKASGPYYVRIEEVEGAPATFCLLYCYK